MSHIYIGPLCEAAQSEGALRTERIVLSLLLGQNVFKLSLIMTIMYPLNMKKIYVFLISREFLMEFFPTLLMVLKKYVILKYLACQILQFMITLHKQFKITN